MKRKLIIISILAFLLMILIVQNTQSVFLNIFFWSITMPQVVFIPILFACGFVIGFLASKIRASRARGTIRNTGAPVLPGRDLKDL